MIGALLPQAREAVNTFDSAARVARALSPAQARPLRIAMTTETSRSVLLDVVSLEDGVSGLVVGAGAYAGWFLWTN